MLLNLKNLIKGGTQKVRFAIKRKEPQISVRISEHKESKSTEIAGHSKFLEMNSKPDLIIGPVWSGTHQVGVNQIDIQLKYLLPVDHKLKIQLVDNRTNWPIKEIDILNGAVTNFQAVTGAQDLNLKFQLLTNQGQLPKVGLTYYIKEVSINTLINHSAKPFKDSIVIDHLVVNKIPAVVLPEKIQMIDLDPLLKWFIDPQPVRELFIDSVDVNSLYKPESTIELDTPSLTDKLLQNQIEWDQLQSEIRDLVEHSAILTKRLSEIEAKQHLTTTESNFTMFEKFLTELDILMRFRKRLQLELYQIEIVLVIHQGQELNESLDQLLHSYVAKLSREILKIEFLIESINLKLGSLLNAYQSEVDLEQTALQIKQHMNELASTYQVKIAVGQKILKNQQNLLIEPVVQIHQKLIARAV